MAGTHIAHDATVGSRCTIVNNVKVGGYAKVGDNVFISANSIIFPKVLVGDYANVSTATEVRSHVPPFSLAAQRSDGVRLVGINIMGLRSCGFEEDTVTELKNAYRDIFRHQKNPILVRSLYGKTEVATMIDFVERIGIQNILPARRPTSK